MLETRVIECDLCVVGGGISGMCAAISAARHGAKTVLMHERPMLGGNASSEIRMWISGAGAANMETGIIRPIENAKAWWSILGTEHLFTPALQIDGDSCCAMIEIQ